MHPCTHALTHFPAPLPGEGDTVKARGEDTGIVVGEGDSVVGGDGDAVEDRPVRGCEAIAGFEVDREDGGGVSSESDDERAGGE